MESSCDIVLVGKTGLGKSTTGNKLLQSKDQSDLRLFTPRPEEVDQTPLFLEGDATQLFSVTSRCELICNESTRIRVLDTPGLADSTNFGVSVVERNKKILNDISKIQQKWTMNYRRLVYFLPVRGVLERFCESLQEELEIMHSFFGDTVFSSMVVVATNPPQGKYQDIGFDEDDLKQTRNAFHEVLKAVTGKSMKCPPVIFIALKDSGADILKKIKSATAPTFVPYHVHSNVHAQTRTHRQVTTARKYRGLIVFAVLSFVVGFSFFYYKWPTIIAYIFYSRNNSTQR